MFKMFKGAKNAAKLINNATNETEIATTISPTAARAIQILSDVPGITSADKRDFGSASPLFALKDGTIVRTWQNLARVGHVFLADPKGRMVFGGYVLWQNSEGLKQAIEQIQQELALNNKQKTRNSKAATVSIESDCGIDYNHLLSLLSDEEWKKADKETARLMLAVMRKQKWWQVSFADVAKFPCKDLSTIDRLWSFYSEGHFGLLVQKTIYESSGGTNYDRKAWEAFGDCVGWRDRGDWLYYEDLTFSIKAPRGHLPSTVLYGSIVEGVPKVFSGLVETVAVRGLTNVGWPMAGLFARIKDCKR
ncbi:MAG: GUN4 domain-containing protein [Oscillatoria sp. SIO1A7]|nr:GUN4 domain-containing protein [Oscillatoria sp. SIO1A7]